MAQVTKKPANKNAVTTARQLPPTRRRERRHSLAFCEPRAIMRIVREQKIPRFTIEQLQKIIDDYLESTPVTAIDDDLASLGGRKPSEFREVLEICVTDMVKDGVLHVSDSGSGYFEAREILMLNSPK